MIGVLSWTTLAHSRQAALEARRTVRVMDQLNLVRALIVDAETSERGYLISDRKEYLEPFRTAVSELPIQTKRLRELALELPEGDHLLERFSRIEELTKSEMDVLHDAITLHDRGELEGATAIVSSGRGKTLMDEIRRLTGELKADVTATWHQRLAAIDGTGSTVAVTTMGGIALLALFVTLLGRWLLSDQSKREAAEAAVRDAEARYRTTLVSLAEGIVATDAEGRVTFMNRVAEELTGVNAASAAGRPCDAVFMAREEETGRLVQSPVLGVLAGDKASSKEGVAMVGVAPSLRHVEYAASPITDAAGATTGAVLVFRDVAERLSAEREREALLASERAARSDAERSSRLKDEFVATLSHELRTPLNAILGWTQILRRAGVDAFTTSQGLEIIERNTRVQTALVADLLDMSRMMSGKLRLEVQSVDLPAVVSDAVNSVRPTAEAKGVNLRSVIDQDAGPVTGDPARLQQIIWNLLSNAIKFTRKGGKVSVRLRKVESQVEIEVEDNGEGIHRDFLPHVFERFRQADASTTRQHGGLGLGLSIARQLVELHGGRIEAHSDGQGLGARFTVRLPMIAVQQGRSSDNVVRPPSRAGDGPGLPQPSLTGIDVLVVEDEADARNLIQLVLADRGATVRLAEGVAQAFELIDQRVPDLVVSDLGMPVQDGFALIRKLRALSHERGGDTPAIALTAFARTEDRTRSLLAGFQAHLTKPVDAAELVATVASLSPKRFSGSEHGHR